MNKVLNLRWRRFVPVGLSALAAAVLLTPAPASATAFVLRMTQQGSNVVATGSGEFDLSSLTNVNTATSLSESPGIYPSTSAAGIGTGVHGALFDSYTGSGTGPTSFGSGGYTSATTGTGDAVAIVIGAFDVPLLFVPTGYVSGTALSDTAIYDNASFASLGATPGTYVWRWGSTADQSFTLVISNAVGVPEPAALGMFGFGVLLIGGFVGLLPARCVVGTSQGHLNANNSP